MQVDESGAAGWPGLSIRPWRGRRRRMTGVGVEVGRTTKQGGPLPNIFAHRAAVLEERLRPVAGRYGFGSYGAAPSSNVRGPWCCEPVQRRPALSLISGAAERARSRRLVSRPLIRGVSAVRRPKDAGRAQRWGQAAGDALRAVMFLPAVDY